MALPPITVSVPTFNRKAQVVGLAAEITRQLKPGDELMVSDDGSTDGTSEALGALPDVTVVRQSHNLGMVGNWNYCLTAGTNDWVCLIHDDDHLVAGGLEIVRRACAIAGEPALIAHGEGLGLRQDPHGGFGYRYREAGRVAALDVEICPSGVTIHRTIPAAVGGFDPQHAYSADMEYFPRVCARFPSLIVTNPQVLQYVVNGDNYQLKTWRKPDFLSRLEAAEAAAIAHAALPVGDATRVLNQRLARDMIHMIRISAAAGDTALVRRTATTLLARPGLSPRRRAGLRLAALLGRAPRRLLV